MSRASACVLCGSETSETHRSLIAWTDPQPGRAYATGDRCLDRPACRARVEASGERWEVDDGTPAPRPVAVQSEPAGHDELEDVFA